jgi:hypothetical protein
VLYECLTRRVPFEKDLDAAIIWAHVEEPPTRPTVLRPELPPKIDEVFGRVLAKRPEERYGSCREFVDAARLALGFSGPGTASSRTYGAAAPPQTGAPSAGRAATPSDGFSWSSVASRARAAGPTSPGIVAAPPTPVPPTSAPLAPAPMASAPPTPVPPTAGQSGGTVASHRREYGAPRPGEPGQPAGAPPPAGRPRDTRWYHRPRWLAALAAAAAVIAALGTWAGLSATGSHAKSSTNTTSPKPKPTHTTSALMSALVVTDNSADAKGLLPPSTCRQDNSATVTCTAPAGGITAVVFRTYPSLKALYAAYTAKVTALDSSHFSQNFSDCGARKTRGEAGWNHNFQHTRKYTVDQMTMGMVTDHQAAGRVFCTYTGGLEYMVWTQNDGRLLGYVAGPVHGDVWTWWVAVHHNIGLGGPMNMGTSPAPASGAGTTPAMASMSPSPSPSPSPSMPMSSMTG